jgi:hypothetical protein
MVASACKAKQANKIANGFSFVLPEEEKKTSPIRISFSARKLLLHAYVCVCLCVCERKTEREREREREKGNLFSQSSF